MSTERTILQANMSACQQRIEKLRTSLAKTEPLFPFTAASVAAMSGDQEEAVDALILRYSQCVSMIQDQIFRGIAYLEQEDIADKSNRDKALLMEKLGAIQSAEAFGSAALLRNKFAHHYPDQSRMRIERLNLVAAESRFVLTCFESIQHYLRRKGLF